MDILLSIKPRFAAAILRGEKRYEFRKSRFARPGDRVLLYATAPVKRIVGTFTVREVHEGSPSALWYVCSGGAGVGRGELLAYFGGRENGFAIEVGEVEAFDPPRDPARLIPGFAPPRSFRYLDRDVLGAAVSGRKKSGRSLDACTAR